MSMVVMPTFVVTVARGFPSEDAFLPGSSFSTMATALWPLPYNRQIDRFTQLHTGHTFPSKQRSSPSSWLMDTGANQRKSAGIPPAVFTDEGQSSVYNRCRPAVTDDFILCKTDDSSSLIFASNLTNLNSSFSFFSRSKYFILFYYFLETSNCLFSHKHPPPSLCFSFLFFYFLLPLSGLMLVVWFLISLTLVFLQKKYNLITQYIKKGLCPNNTSDSLTTQKLSSAMIFKSNSDTILTRFFVFLMVNKTSLISRK